MPIAPIDLTALVATIMGISIVLIPVIGLTARFALKPTVEALSRFLDHRGLDETVLIHERRMALIEQQVDSIDASVKRLVEVVEFERALGAGEKTPDASGPSEPPRL